MESSQSKLDYLAVVLELQNNTPNTAARRLEELTRGQVRASFGPESLQGLWTYDILGFRSVIQGKFVDEFGP